MIEATALPRGVTEVSNLGVTMVYSGMEVGNVDRRYGELDDVLTSRAKLIATLAPTKYIIQMPRCSNEFLDLSGVPVEDLEDKYSTDGLFIDEPNIALGLNPADCIAMVLYGKNSPTFAVIHAGRQGISGGIHESSVEHLVDVHNVARQDVRILFGPCISPDSYYFPEGHLPEQLADPSWRYFIDRRNGNHHVDLAARVIKDLAEVGIEPVQIQTRAVDVGAEGSGYFSHARSKRTGEPDGRNGLAAMRRG